MNSRGTINQEMATLSTHLQKSKLQLSITKTVTTAFYLYKKEARRKPTPSKKDLFVLNSPT